tara:strand:+ start:828 stop:1037 length:210 start_codon:yes stop_codon:yes gene_type:complete
MGPAKAPFFKQNVMTDQTRWGIPEVQLKNKQKAYKERTEMREEVKDYVSNCSVFELQEIYKEMKRLRKK